MTAAEFFSGLSAILLTSAAVVGAGTAVVGLSTWRKQLNWQTDHNLARRILVLLFRYRDVLYGVRHPAIFTYEMPAPSEEKGKNMSPEQIRFYGTAKAYEDRWAKVSAVRSELYPELLEAEALWGDALSKLMSPMDKLQHELHNGVRRYIKVINPDEHQGRKDAAERAMNATRDILYDDFDDEDVFRTDFQSEMDKLEDYLRGKLGSKTP